MTRSISTRIAALVVAAAGLAGCDNTISDTGITSPTLPVVNVTETFTGTLPKNGAISHPFPVNTGGTVTATLKELTPDSTLTLGMALGTWNGTNCKVELTNDATIQGSVLIATVSAYGQLCVRLYDAQGGVAAVGSSSSYTVDVNHP